MRAVQYGGNSWTAGTGAMGVGRRGIERRLTQRATQPWPSNSPPIGNAGPKFTMKSIYGYCFDAFVYHLSLPPLEGIQNGSENGHWGRSWIQRAGGITCPRFYQRRDRFVHPLEGLFI